MARGKGVAVAALTWALAAGSGCAPDGDGAGMCNGRSRLHAGNLQLGDGAIDRPQCIEFVSGDVAVVGTAMADLAPLRGLVHIGGDLIVEDNGQLGDLGDLAALVQVSGAIRIVDNPRLSSLAGPLLDEVGGDVTVESNPELVDLALLQEVEELAGGLVIVDNDALADLGALTALRSIGGRLVVRLNDSLEGLDELEVLTRVAGDLEVEHNPALASLMSRTASVGGHVSVRDNGALTVIPGLQLGGEATRASLADNPALEVASVALWGGRQQLSVHDNTALAELIIDARGWVDELLIDGNPSLSRLELSSLGLPVVDDLLIADTALRDLQDVNLKGIACFATFRNNTELQRLWRGSSWPSLAATFVSIHDNPQLPTCEVAAWVDGQQEPGGRLGPWAGCSSVDAGAIDTGVPTLLADGNDDDASCE